MTYQFDLSNVRCRPHCGIQRMLDVFTGPMTQSDLREAAGLSVGKVSLYLAKLLTAQPRQAHISGWTHARSGRGQATMVFSPGPGDDVPCALPTSVKTARPPAPPKAPKLPRRPDDIYDWTIYRSKSKHKRPRDPLTTALFGPTTTRTHHASSEA